MVVTMSGKEFSRLDVLLNVEAGRLAISDAFDLSGCHRGCGPLTGSGVPDNFRCYSLGRLEGRRRLAY